jgi:hypothetical protein
MGPDRPRRSRVIAAMAAENDPRLLAINLNEDIQDACTLAIACIDRFVEDGNADAVDIAAGLLHEVVDELEAFRALSRSVWRSADDQRMI